MHGDTIAAIATARGRGGIAVVRVSGPDAFAVAMTVAGVKGSERRFEFAVFRDCVESSGGNPVDSGIVLCFKGPQSYTGEDVVEFQCHGGEVVPRRILSACIAAGARMAQRGEFTRRAFLNGKIGYSEAEAVLDLIDAKTSRAADSAYARLCGKKRIECRELYERALEISAKLEHALDVDEGELPASFATEAVEAVDGFRSSLRSAVIAAKEGRILRNGALVVLSGPPNVGKSSLMNALLESNRAIVSDVPGTTRDFIEEWLDIGGWPVKLVDTAGIREAEDKVEAEGVKRTLDLAARADVVLSLSEASFQGEVPANGIAVATKCDLAAVPCDNGAIAVSALTGEGLERLKSAIAQKLAAIAASDDFGDSAADLPGSELEEALAMMDGIFRCDGLSTDDPVLLANAMRLVAGKLGEILGEVYSDDLLDRLFERFCVGK